MIELDEIDRRLLELLQGNARLSNAELGQAVGLSVSAATERVRKLVERGVITGFHAHVEPESVDMGLLVMVFVATAEPEAERRFLAEMRKCPCVLECHHVTGSWNHLMKVRIENTRMLEAFFTNVVKKIKGVVRTETLVVLSSSKEVHTLPTTAPDWMPR